MFPLSIRLTTTFFDKWLGKNAVTNTYVDQDFFDFYQNNQPVLNVFRNTLYGSSGHTEVKGTSAIFNDIQASLLLLRDYLNSRTATDPICQSSEGAWLRNLAATYISSITVFVIVDSEAWLPENWLNHRAQFIPVDHSIGYIDGIYAFSVLMHEYNDFPTTSPFIFLENTHLLAQNAQEEYIALQDYLKAGDALDYFRDSSGNFQNYQNNRPYHKLFQYTPSIGLVYLDHYQSIIL